MSEMDIVEILKSRIENLMILNESLSRSLSRAREKNETLELLLAKYENRKYTPPTT